MNLTEAIVVKISHDLAGGIGAMASTCELMEIDPAFTSEAGSMLKKNSLMLMARLRFYRALFGAETREINASVVTDYLETWGQKIIVEGNVQNRLQLSLLAVGIICLVQGGKIIIKNNTIILSGSEISMRSDFQAVLENKEELITPETVEAVWLMQQLEEQGKTLKIISKSKSTSLEIL